MPGNYSESPRSSHSNELERRLTRLEVRQDNQLEQEEPEHDRLDKRLTGIEARMSLHEKAILAIAAVLQIALQDKYPAFAKSIKTILQP